MSDTTSSAPARVLERLRDGNRRFQSGTANRFSAEEAELRRQLARGQAPDAVILTCSDSRVHPTLVFDQGLGDLFTVRVAGNVVSREVLGSIEFAVGQLGSRFILILGHTGCGAVAATIDEMRSPDADLSANLRSLTDRIRPAVESALADRADAEGSDAPEGLLETDRDAVLERAIRANIAESARALRQGSELVARLAESGDLTIMGAEYCLETGLVDFLDAM